jgi:RNA polymerase primary sigma factor
MVLKKPIHALPPSHELAEDEATLPDESGARGAAGAVDEHSEIDLDYVDPDDLLDVYLTEMALEPLLTFEEEVKLAEQIRDGRQAQRSIRGADYTTEEYERLQTRVEAGQAARERLSRANTRLVVSIAKRYRGYGLPFVDLIQDGNEGLMRAVDRYDPRGGYRFSTYATWWIRQAVTRALSNHRRVIRIPVHVDEQMRRMYRVAQQLEMEGGRKPSLDEIATAMGESSNKIQEMMLWASETLSLEQPMGEEGNSELGDVIPDHGYVSLDEQADQELLRESIHSLIDTLSAREARIVRMRYGFVDGQMRTLQEIADQFGLSRERVRQIEREAFAKLRLAGTDYRLRDFLSVR